MTRLLLVAALVATPLLAGGVPARADGVKIIVGGGGSRTVTSSTTVMTPRAAAPRTFVRESVFSPRFIPDVPVHRHGFHHGHHHGTVFVSPAPQCAQLPGSWSYVWVPQSATYTVWVPSHWSPEGTWIAGHYASQTYATGSYHPVWVPGRLVC